MNSNIFFRVMTYLDPGTGSFIIQILLAGILGIAVAVRIYWKKIKNFFQGKNKNNIVEDLDEIDEYEGGSGTSEE